MISTTTTRFTEKQSQIDLKRREVVGNYPALWHEMISAWQAPGDENAAWLIYSANYLFRTDDIRWAVDPLSLHWRIPEAPLMDVRRDLQALDFVLLTHSHKDHLDHDLLSALRDLPIHWVVPEFMLPRIREYVGLPEGRIQVAQPLQPFEIQGFRITPFNGLHFSTEADGTRSGLPELGYLVEFQGQRWLFPGDTRAYVVENIPAFGPVDVLFAHLWLGRGAALQEPLPYLDDFCQFCGGLQPGRVILTHLQDLGRDADDYWDSEHVETTIRRFRTNFPRIPMLPAFLGEKVIL